MTTYKIDTAHSEITFECTNDKTTLILKKQIK